jgi:hypothetical protein
LDGPTVQCEWPAVAASTQRLQMRRVQYTASRHTWAAEVLSKPANLTSYANVWSTALLSYCAAAPEDPFRGDAGALT